MPSHNTNKFKSNTIVMYGHYKEGIPAFVESPDNSNEHPDVWRYSITMLRHGTFYVPERHLRPMTWPEFAWFRHPVTGKMMVGRNPAWQIVFIHLVALATIIGSWRILDGWMVIGIAVGMLVGNWVFTYKQFNGTQV